MEQDNSHLDKLNINPAWGPYNFVPLNDTIIPGENIPNFNQYSSERYSGFIELLISAQTPIFIRGKDENFFKINDTPVIPGSSIRGMLRVLIEIMSHSKLDIFDDSPLYYREVAASKESTIGKLYRDQLNASGAGYLCYSNNAYFIRPATGKPEKVKLSDSELTQEFIYQEDNDNPGGMYVITGNFGETKKNKWRIPPPDSTAAVIDIPTKDIEDYLNDKNRSIGDLDILENARAEENRFPVFYAEYTDVHGIKRVKFGHTKNFRLPYAKKISESITQTLASGSENTKDISAGLFGYVNDDDTMAGRLYFEDAYLEGETEDFAEAIKIPKILSNPKTTSFQLYLKQNYGLNTELNQMQHWDSEESKIRGFKLYFHHPDPKNWINTKFTIKKGDFELYLDNIINICDDEDYKILINSIGPLKYINISSKYSTYLSGDKDKVKFLKDYDDFPIELKLLFNKYFFIPEMDRKTYGITGPQVTPIRPIKSGAKFTRARIRFSNLSKVELGSLLFAIELPNGCYHKLGMAKPLGLGSVEVSGYVQLIDRARRYSSLFNDSSFWESGFIKNRFDIKDFKNAFADYVLNGIHSKEKGTSRPDASEKLWEEPRLKELKILLGYNDKVAIKKWYKRMEYMEVAPPDDSPNIEDLKKHYKYNTYRDRYILPSPSEQAAPVLYDWNKMNSRDPNKK